jgi:hypothetical protein
MSTSAPPRPKPKPPSPPRPAPGPPQALELVRLHRAALAAGHRAIAAVFLAELERLAVRPGHREKEQRP